MLDERGRIHADNFETNSLSSLARSRLARRPLIQRRAGALFPSRQSSSLQMAEFDFTTFQNSLNGVCSHLSDSSSNLIDSLCNRIAYRQILESDIPEVIGFLVSTGSNSRSVGKIPASDVNPDAIRARLQSGHSGRVAWANRSLIGFSMANRTNGEVWAMAIAPEWEGKDIDRELMRQTEAWLFSHGWAEIWAAMPPEENAPGFCNGPVWQDWKRERDRYIKKAGVQSVLRLEEHAFTGPTTGYQRLVRL